MIYATVKATGPTLAEAVVDFNHGGGTLWKRKKP